MDYIKRDKKRKLKENLIKLLIFLLVFLILILSYIVYQNTNLEQTNLSEKNVTIEKTYQTIDNIKKNNETVTDMLSNLSSSVVGISKMVRLLR